ncbi:MAG: GNAT family N-acetyltransferase [Bacteroidota bacterium]
MSVRPVPAAAVRPLRGAILRPGEPPDSLVYPGDDAQLAFHAGGFLGEEIHGIATVYPETPPLAHLGGIPEAAYAEGAAFRLRGMATSEAARGTGMGRELLLACFAHIRRSGGSFLWCNARSGALGFYERMGLETVGEEFDLPPIGPHFVMWIAI